MLYFSRPSKKCVKVQVHSVVSNSLQPPGLYSPWNSLRQNSGMDSLSLLQGIFPIQGSNQGLPHCRQTLYQLSHREALKKRNVYKEINNSSICVCVCVCSDTILCPTLCKPMDCSPPGSSIHVAFRARILELFFISSSCGSPEQGIEPIFPI